MRATVLTEDLQATRINDSSVISRSKCESPKGRHYPTFLKSIPSELSLFCTQLRFPPIPPEGARVQKQLWGC